MLVTKLANSTSHDYLAERFRAAYDFLTSSDLMSPIAQGPGQLDTLGRQVGASSCPNAILRTMGTRPDNLTKGTAILVTTLANSASHDFLAERVRAA